jgi:peptide/nickel transport system ATP-binding protein
MQKGKIVETGDTEGLFSNPQHPYTRSLLSAIPIPDPRKERQRQIDTAIT